RQRRVPLTPEQSARLTAWALAQNGKRFAVVRVGAQLTPLRSRGPLRTSFAGGPHGERRTYFCSELVGESCVAAGLGDPAGARAGPLHGPFHQPLSEPPPRPVAVLVPAGTLGELPVILHAKGRLTELVAEAPGLGGSRAKRDA